MHGANHTLTLTGHCVCEKRLSLLRMSVQKLFTMCSTVKKDRYKLSYFTLITHVYQMIKHVIG